MDSTCKHCGALFQPERPDQQYHSNACRQAAYRKRLAPLPLTEWIGDRPSLPLISRTYNVDGTLALSQDELGQRLVQIAHEDDDGGAKTGRRYYYLALMHGYIQPDMSTTKVGKGVSR
jgi:hypothetical protein